MTLDGWDGVDVELARREMLAALHGVRLDRAGALLADAVNEDAKRRLRTPRSVASRRPREQVGLTGEAGRRRYLQESGRRWVDAADESREATRVLVEQTDCMERATSAAEHLACDRRPGRGQAARQRGRL
jgi:hypothetical protein